MLSLEVGGMHKKSSFTITNSSDSKITSEHDQKTRSAEKYIDYWVLTRSADIGVPQWWSDGTERLVTEVPYIANGLSSAVDHLKSSVCITWTKEGIWKQAIIWW
jgi:hypothetical protein